MWGLSLRFKHFSGIIINRLWTCFKGEMFSLNENMLAVILCAICLLPGFVISIVLISGRGAFLIAGYNTQPKHKQQQWNEKAMCRFVGILLLSFLFLETGGLIAVLFFGNTPIFIVCMAVGTLGLLGGVLYLNKSRRFKR